VPVVNDRLLQRVHVATTLLGSGFLAPMRPDRAARALMALRRWGTTSAGALAVTAARSPARAAIIDELGTLTYAEEQRRTNALASSLRRHGIRPGDSVAIMCRNHRGFIDVTVACAKLGAHVIYLNTAFAAPQLTAVVEREDTAAIVYDEEFAAVVEGVRTDRKPTTRSSQPWSGAFARTASASSPGATARAAAAWGAPEWGAIRSSRT
jgi:fatty-acyl-CoA synthase